MMRPADVALPVVGDGSGLEPDVRLYPEELQLALRNHALPLEGLRDDVTPTGLHATLLHYDNPVVDLASWQLMIDGQVQRPCSLRLALPRAEALHEDALLAWAMNGAPLEPQHGAPLRLVIPGWYGMAHVKWLHAITALTAPFTGYQQATAYRPGPRKAAGALCLSRRSHYTASGQRPV